MTIETKLAIFKDKYELSDEAIVELKTIFDSIIVDFAHKIMNNESSKTIPKLNTTPVIYSEKKFATKIAAEYASECNVSLQDIPSETGKVTKKDVEKYVKSKTGTTNSKKSKISQNVAESDTEIESRSASKLKCNPVSKSGTKSVSKTDFETENESECETKKIVSKKEKNITKQKCNGVTKDGNPCNLNATKNPDGSKKCYCFRHAIDWKQYEVSSDSDYENEEKTEEKVDTDLIHKDIDIVESD
jgi:hypothetical protein